MHFLPVAKVIHPIIRLLDMKKITLLMAVLLCVLTVHAKPGVRFDISDEYMVSLIGVNTGGVKIVSVTAYGKNERDATQRAKMDAVAAALFRGLPAGSESLADVPSLLSFADYDSNNAYFRDFFDSGKYLRFVNETYGSTPSGTDNMQAGRKRRVGVVLEILRDKLQQQLADDGILSSMAEASDKFGGAAPTVMVIPDPEWMKSNNIAGDDFKIGRAHV